MLWIGKIRTELSPSRRSKLLIERGRPLKRRTRLETRDVVDEFRPLGQEIEHHAPAERRTKDDVGGGKLLAHQVRAFGDGVGAHVHHRVEIAITKHGAPRLLLAGEGTVGDRRLDAAWAEEQP